MRSGLKV